MWNVRQIHKEKVEKGHLGPLYSHYIYIMGKGPINWLVLPNVKKLYRGINFKEKEAKSSIHNNQNTSVVIQSQYPRSQFNFLVFEVTTILIGRTSFSITRSLPLNFLYIKPGYHLSFIIIHIWHVSPSENPHRTFVQTRPTRITRLLLG